MIKLTDEQVLSLVNSDSWLTRGLYHGVIEKPQGGVLYEGPRFTVQDVANWFEVSDSTARRAVHKLAKRGLVTIFSVYEPGNGLRRLLIAPK